MRMLVALEQLKPECSIYHVIKGLGESILYIILSKILHVAGLRHLMMLIYHILNLFSSSIKQ
jgi:hypothetical protein